MKRFVGPSVLVVLSTLFALLLGEAAVRALYKDETVMFPRYHTDYRYGRYTLRGIRPNSKFRHTSVDGSWTFVHNSRGMRDSREFRYDKPAGTIRVLALGDSNTQGYEVRQNETYAAVLERYLAKHGVRAEVLNAGVSGFSTAEALAYLENEGYKYQPDVVVLGFSANDYEDNLKAGLFALEGKHLVERRYEHVPGVRIQNVVYSLPGVQWLSENSYLYSLVFNGVWLYFRTALDKQALRNAPLDMPELEYAVAMQSELSPYQVALAVALIERMHKFCRDRGMRLIVVDIPRDTGRYGIAESIPAGLLKDAEYVSSSALFGEVAGVAETHVPNGHRHISELSHALIGLELGRRILRR
jgi:GDSL-like lipase/acylhydrolase family protein